MLTLKTTIQFRKDYKTAKKRGYNMELLENVIQTLIEQKPLEEKHHDHPLTGKYIGFRECHIQPDWLYWNPCRLIRQVKYQKRSVA